MGGKRELVYEADHSFSKRTYLHIKVNGQEERLQIYEFLRNEDLDYIFD